MTVLVLGHPLTIQRCIRKLKNDSHRPVPQNQILSNCPHLSRLTVHPFLSVSIYRFHFFHYFLSVHCCTLACDVLNLATRTHYLHRFEWGRLRALLASHYASLSWFVLESFGPPNQAAELSTLLISSSRISYAMCMLKHRP